MRHPAVHIQPPRGRLGVLLVGLGAVSTTFVAGVHAVRRGLAQPVDGPFRRRIEFGRRQRLEPGRQRRRSDFRDPRAHIAIARPANVRVSVSARFM